MGKRDREGIKEAILASSTYKKFKRIVASIQDQFDPASIENEIRQLHAGRLVRNLKATSIDPKQMIETVGREIAYRSRIVEIRVSLVDHRVNLDKSIKAMKNYLMTEFDIEGFRYKNEKEAYLSRYLRSAEFLLSEIDRLIDTCDQVVHDIDQAGYGLKLIKDSLEMIYVKERTI